jgi:trigger factor
MAQPDHDLGDILLLTVTTEALENCEVLMTVEVDEKRTDRLLQSAARRISRQVRIPGFRPGKAPYNVIVRRMGEEVVRNEALEDLGQSVFKEALEQAELEPYAQASLEDVTWDPLVMKARVPTAPVVELGDYRAMRLEVEPVEVSEEEVNETLEDLRREQAVWNPVERPAQLGDQVTMSVKEQAEDQVLAEQENVEYELTEVDEGSPGADLTTPLVGLSAGEEKEFSVSYPEDADPRYAGKEVTVSVEMHSVKEIELYPLDDDFAQSVGDFDTLEQLKENLREDIHQRKQRDADNELGQQALEQLIEDADRVDWPLVLEDEEIDQALDEQDRRLQQSGLNLENYLTIQKKTRDELREEFRPSVQERLRRSLVLGKFVELEGLSVEGHEITNQIDRMSLMAGEQGTEMRDALATPDGVRYVANDLITSKATERLVQIVKGEAEAEEETEAEEIETGIEMEAEAAAEVEIEADEEEIETEKEKETEEVEEIEAETEAEADTDTVASG